MQLAGDCEKRRSTKKVIHNSSPDFPLLRKQNALVSRLQFDVKTSAQQ